MVNDAVTARNWKKKNQNEPLQNAIASESESSAGNEVFFLDGQPADKVNQCRTACETVGKGVQRPVLDKRHFGDAAALEFSRRLHVLTDIA